MDRTKLISSLVAAVIIPIVVGVVTNISSSVVQKKLEAGNDPPKAALAEPVKGAGPGAGVGAAGAATPGSPPPATGASPFHEALGQLRRLPTVHLFNGRNLDGFFTYLGPKEPEGTPVGRVDPDGVFSVTREGLLLISGKELGGLTTSDPYEDYLLTVEYRWGRMTYAPRQQSPRIGAVAFHAFGPPGAILEAWMQGYRVRLDENGTGDLAIQSRSEIEPSLTVEVEPHHFVATGKAAKGDRTIYSFKPGGSPRPFTPISEQSRAIAFRLGTLRPDARYNPGPEAGPSFEKPMGEWNTLEILCLGDTVGVILNGTLVNAANVLTRTSGRIQLETNRADLYIKTVDLRRIPVGQATLPGLPTPTPRSLLARAPAEKKARGPVPPTPAPAPDRATAKSKNLRKNQGTPTKT